MFNRKYQFAVLAALVIFGLFSFFRSKNSVNSVLSLAEPRLQSKPIASAKPRDTESAVLEQRQLASSIDKAVSPEFVRWFTEESHRIEAQDINTQQTEVELKKRVAKLSTAEVDYLVKVALTPRSSASERILASYLLSLIADTSSEGLVSVASQPVENPGPHPAHSVDEARVMQERAFRIMAIDSIVNRTGDNKLKINDLQKIINQTSDVTVKNYAAQKAEEISAL